MYSNILIPISMDQSRDVDASIEAAKALADKGAQFTLMHVVEYIPAYATELIPMNAIDDNRSVVKSKLDALAAKLPNARVFVADGKPAPRILRWCEENGCDCIIIASHDPGFSDYLLGSTALNVVRHAKCSIFVVR